MEKLRFKNLLNAVTELQQGQGEILALLPKKAKPQPEIEPSIQLKEVSSITGNICSANGYLHEAFDTSTKRTERCFSTNIESFDKANYSKKNVLFQASPFSLFSQLVIELMKSDAFFTNHNIKLS